MSYLLKALEKAEQERQQKLQSDDVETVTRVEKTALPKSLAVIVVALLALTLWQVWPSASDSAIEHDVAYNNEKDANEEVLNAVSHGDEPLMAKNIPDNSTKVSPAVQAPKSLSDLTPQELARIPSLNLASHIYSSAAEFRSVVINDQTYQEGALIRPGLKLEEINQSGIVINVHGQKVELPKGISWVASQDVK